MGLKLVNHKGLTLELKNHIEQRLGVSAVRSKLPAVKIFIPKIQKGREKKYNLSAKTMVYAINQLVHITQR